MPAPLKRPAAPILEVPVEIRVSQIAECLLGLRLACLPASRWKGQDVSTEWFDRIRTLAPDDLNRALAAFQRFEHAATLWLQLSGVIAEDIATVPELLVELESTPAEELWRQMLGLHSWPEGYDPRPRLQEALARAGAGEPTKLEQELQDLDPVSRRWVPEVVRMFSADAQLARDHVLTTLRLWYAHVFRLLWPDLERGLEQDAAAKRSLSRQVSWSELVARATKGIEYVPEVGVDRLLLVPSLLNRPTPLTVRQRRTVVICYPVDEASGLSHEARVARIVKYARALGDENRVHALRRLAGSTLTLQELADDLRLAKSTMHHHVAILRSSGLLRVRPDHKTYSLREEAVLELETLLASTLRRPEESAALPGDRVRRTLAGKQRAADRKSVV